ncbi:MAG: 2Fe-2S iron-sulfur cluster binding domain-containing protein [Methylococcales bacterium]|nr:2Fe-2S iron-sulfur cluster binding domain-containing protein [Methylococcales bacterium]
MTKLTIGEKDYNCEPDEVVLDALLRQDVDISYACRQGTCQTCLLRCTDKVPLTKSQSGLKDTLINQGYFLSCLCVPEQDMTIKLPEQSDFFSEGKVVVNEMLNRNTILLVVECQDILEYKAGQFVNLQREDGLTRSYSISNIPQQSKTLEFHIRRLPGGQFSEWVHDEIKVGDQLLVSEPQGHCFYLPDRKEQGILLVGTGSGLAPLAGIISDALSHGHTGTIHLFHGSSELEDLYRIDEMRQLSRDVVNFNYTPCISRGEAPEGFSSGRAHKVALDALPDLTGWRVFLCGHPEMIAEMKTQAFLKGASVADIYTDAFHVSVNE